MTTTSPVTQTAGTAVNNAGTGPVLTPDSVAIGSIDNAVPIKVAALNTSTTILAECRALGNDRRHGRAVFDSDVTGLPQQGPQVRGEAAPGQS